MEWHETERGQTWTTGVKCVLWVFVVIIERNESCANE